MRIRQSLVRQASLTFWMGSTSTGSHVMKNFLFWDALDETDGQGPDVVIIVIVGMSKEIRR